MNQKTIRYYRAKSGKIPFEQWISRLKDSKTRARIFRRIERVALGNYGDCKSVGSGVLELRLAFGAGYRVYFAEENGVAIILLVGGDKSTQQTDIDKAKQYWCEFKSLRYEGESK